jgi:hypothetical protein
VLACSAATRAEDNGGVSDGIPPGLAIDSVPYDHLVAGHKQVLEIRAPYERWVVSLSNTTDSSIRVTSISGNGNNQNFYIDPFNCAGVVLKPHEGCHFLVQWIPVDSRKRVFNDVVVISGESETEEYATSLFLKAVPDAMTPL